MRQRNIFRPALFAAATVLLVFGLSGCEKSAGISGNGSNGQDVGPTTSPQPRNPAAASDTNAVSGAGGGITGSTGSTGSQQHP